MRDILVTTLLLGPIPYVLMHPYVGALLWVIVGVLNPHRLTWSFAYAMPFAAITAGATFIGIVVSKDPKRFPINGVTVTLALFMVWVTITTPLGFYPDLSFDLWNRVIKVLVFVFVTIIVIHSRRHVQLLVWALVVSLGFYGVKGGLFTVLSGGSYRVYGPGQSFIEDNNSLALALAMVIPLFYYLVGQARQRWLKLSLLASMVLCAFASLGSHSRGALVAIAAMTVFLWLKSDRKAIVGLGLIVVAPLMIMFMPENWSARMTTISGYEADASAQGRINAWWMAYNLAKDRFTGGGFAISTPDIFARYAPNPDAPVLVAHSIYFEVLGQHGFPGLFLFLLLWYLTWRCANWVIKQSKGEPDLEWARSLAAMIQVSLVAYAVGGAFLSLSYFDLPYYELAALVIMREIIRERQAQPTIDQVSAASSTPIHEAAVQPARLQ